MVQAATFTRLRPKYWRHFLAGGKRVVFDLSFFQSRLSSRPEVATIQPIYSSEEEKSGRKFFLLGVYSKLSTIVNGALHISLFPAQVVRFQRIYRSAPSEKLLREFHEETCLNFWITQLHF